MTWTSTPKTLSFSRLRPSNWKKTRLGVGLRLQQRGLQAGQSAEARNRQRKAQTHKWRLKRHAIDRFWGWVASWAAIIGKPSDLGYEDDGFILPPLNIINHKVDSNKILPGHLFPKMAETLTERRDARRESVEDKIKLTKAKWNL